MLNEEWLKTFIPIGVLKNEKEWAAIGAGFFFHKSPFVWIVTAHHVVRDAGQYPITILVRQRDKKTVIPINLSKIHAQHGLEWVIDEKNDLAVTLMPLSSDIEIKSVTEDHCMKFAEILPSFGCLTVGCPYGLHTFDPQNTTPLVLNGVIAGKNESEKLIYTSAPTFPGNSGGPLIIIKSPFEPGGGAVIGPKTVYLGGIVKKLLVVHADTAKKEGIPPLHVGEVVPVDPLLELLASEKVNELTKRLNKKA